MQKNIVKCDKCGRNIKINPRYKKEGELEYRYFTCRRCKAVFVISVTDGVLREEIKRYQELMENAQGKVMPPETAQEMQLILKNNVERSRKLKVEHPLILKSWEK